MYFLRATAYMLQCVPIWYGNSIRLFVCLLHAWILSKRLNIIIEILSLFDRPIILVFVTKGVA